MEEENLNISNSSSSATHRHYHFNVFSQQYKVENQPLAFTHHKAQSKLS